MILNTEQFKKLVEFTREASNILLTYYEGHKEYKIIIKSDKSPVTSADHASHDFLVKNLPLVYPCDVLSEESDLEAWSHQGEKKSYWLIDPLDGTKEFLKKTGEFAINITLIEDGILKLGLIAIPCEDALYIAALNEPSYKTTLFKDSKSIILNAVDKPVGVFTKVLMSQTQPAREIDHITFSHPVQINRCGSSIKFCRIAEGEADFMYRARDINTWDTASGEMLVVGAGGVVTNAQGEAMNYQSSCIANPGIWVARRIDIP